MRTSFLVFLGALSSPLFCASTQAEDWRHSAHNGTHAQTDLPSQFSKTENIHWIADLQGQGTSFPVIWENRIFLIAAVVAEEGITVFNFGTDDVLYFIGNEK